LTKRLGADRPYQSDGLGPLKDVPVLSVVIAVAVLVGFRTPADIIPWDVEGGRMPTEG
jgi:hypothetical protein